MEQAPQGRIEELEKLISLLRHDVRGIVSPAALIADQLARHGDPGVQRLAARISGVIERLISALDATYSSVAPQDGSGPTIAPHGR